METREIEKIFYRDGYRLAHHYLEEGFTEKNLSGAISALYRAIDELIGSFLDRSSSEGVPASCRKGCSWCCHHTVFAVTHEFLFLMEAIRVRSEPDQQKEYEEKARARAALTSERSLEDQLLVRKPCPFLHHDSCSIYEARPMACRIYLSASEESCRLEHDLPEDQERHAELFDFPLRAGRMLNEGFVAYLKQSGLPSAELPVEQGYLSMLAHPVTMAGWLRQRGDFA